MSINSGAFLYNLHSINRQVSVKKPYKSTERQQENNHHSFKVLMSRPILMPLGIGLTLLAIQQLSGIDTIIFFTVEIFRSSGIMVLTNQNFDKLVIFNRKFNRWKPCNNNCGCGAIS